MSIEVVRDRQRGCMYGLAIGDALGAAVEFQMPGEFVPVTGYRSGGPHGLDAGQWTDDTSMALALADSLNQTATTYEGGLEKTECKIWGFDKADQLRRYLKWWQDGEYSVNGWCFDIGGTTKSALWEFETNGKTTAAYDNYSQGNGSIMRLAPVAIAYGVYASLADRCRNSSETTHAHPNCTEACAILGSMLGKFMHSGDRDPKFLWWLLDDLVQCVDSETPYFKMLVEARDGFGTEAYKAKPVKGSGYVVESLEASLWAFLTSDSFEEAVLKAVNLGDDADTTGAVTGQLAGAYWGYSGISRHLIDGLDRKDMIDRYLDPIMTKEAK